MAIRRVRGAALLLLQCAAVAVLWQAGDAGLAVPLDGFRRWLATAPPDVAIAAFVRLLGLALVGWLLLGSLAALAARASGRPAAADLARRLTLPLLRPLVDRTLALALAGAALTPGPALALPPATAATSTFDPSVPALRLPPAGTTAGPSPTGPAPAAPPPPPATPLPGPATPGPPPPATATGQAGGGGAAPYLPPGFTGVLDDSAAQTTPSTSAPPAPAPSAPAGSPTTTPGDAQTYTVVDGDHLWGIAVSRVADATREPTARDVHAYWLRLIEANQTTLRSRDPDLIFPGEVLALPPLADPTP